MATKTIGAPLVVIVGPTASGKTGLAIDLAERFGGEIICADSRSVYKGMDIGTAKPTAAERARVVHWGLDLVEPNQTFSAARFKDYANEKIREIRERNNIPLLVGGTGLYVDAVIFDYQFSDVKNATLRSELEGLSITELHEYCSKNNIQLPENNQNKRYVIRAIEQGGVNSKRQSVPIKDCIIVGIATEREVLLDRIGQRAGLLFEDGVIEEARLLGKKYGWDGEAMTGNIYPLAHSYLDGKISQDELKEKFIILDRQLAKRQITWLKRNPYINWLGLNDANTYLSQLLAEYNKS